MLSDFDANSTNVRDISQYNEHTNGKTKAINAGGIVVFKGVVLVALKSYNRFSDESFFDILHLDVIIDKYKLIFSDT